MTEGAVYEYEIPLKSGGTRKGLYLCAGDRFVEAAPLPGFSVETFEDAKEELLSLFTANKKEPFSPSVAYAISCLSEKKYDLKIGEHCALLRSIDELPKKLGYKRYKLKIQNLSLYDAISFTSDVYNQVRVPLRIDCNQTWTLHQTLSYLTYFSPDIIEYIEEPTGSLSDTLTLAKQTAHQIALDESLLHTPFSTIQTLAQNVVFVLKPMLLGPLSPFLHLPAKKHVLSSSFETGIGMRWLLNHMTLSKKFDPFIGCDTYGDLLYDPIDPPCLGDISWNVRLKNGLKLLHRGPLSLTGIQPIPTLR